MKSVVVYFTVFGHTKRLAEAIAEQLATAGSARAVAADAPHSPRAGRPQAHFAGEGGCLA